VQKNGMAHRRAELGTASMVGKSGPIERKKVWDLEIEEEHEFFANDILVHNCDSFSGAIADRRLGSFGHVSFTSFHAAHIISMGVGGGVFTSDPVLAKNVRMYRDWGRQADSTKMNTYKSLPKDYNPRFIYEKIGYNFQILDLQAAMGRVQLKKVSTFKRLRKKNFDYLYKYFKEHTMFCVPESVKGADVCWFAFPLTYAGDRGKLVAHLEKNGIETRSMMSGNILRHPAYGNVEYRIGSTLKEADYILEHSFWITCHVSLTKKDLDRIVKTFDDFFA
jgi:CDP-6-deoxy-D-xylo-4-hexulose-3-dehydrase